MSSALDLSKSYLIKLFKPNQPALRKPKPNNQKTAKPCNKQRNQKELYQCCQQNLREEVWNLKKNHFFVGFDSGVQKLQKGL